MVSFFFFLAAVLVLMLELCNNRDNPQRFKEFDIPDNVRAKLEEKIRHKLMPTATKIRAGVSMWECVSSCELV